MNEGKEIEVEKSYASEVQRALVVLGFSEAEGGLGRGLETFSRWVDRVASLPENSEELKATWTSFMTARFGSSEPPMTRSTVEESTSAAWHAITMQLRYFPPHTSQRTGETSSSYAEEWTELCAWREAAKGLQVFTTCSSPSDLAIAVSEADAIARRWQDIAERDGCLLKQWIAAAKSIGFASPSELAESSSINFGQFVDRKVVREWQDATGCGSPDGAKSRIDALYKTDEHRARTTNNVLAEIEHWKTETKCLTATGAGELIKSLRTKLESAQSKAEELSTKLHERDQDLLTANAEIDRVKAAARTLGLVSDDAKELAKVRAELHTKRQEVQTEKERADRAEGPLAYARTKLVSIGQTIEHSSVGWSDVEAWCKEAKETLASAIIPLPKPEKVEVGQRWANITNVSHIFRYSTGVILELLLDNDMTRKPDDLISGEHWIYLGKP